MSMISVVLIGTNNLFLQGLRSLLDPAQFSIAGEARDLATLQARLDGGLAPGGRRDHVAGVGVGRTRGVALALARSRRCERDGRSDIRRAFVLEWSGLHACPRSAIACRMRRGVIGETSNSAPSGRNASLIALAIAAGGAMAPPSPMPLTPNSVYGASVSIWSRIGAGTSVAPGSR